MQGFLHNNNVLPSGNDFFLAIFTQKAAITWENGPIGKKLNSF